MTLADLVNSLVRVLNQGLLALGNFFPRFLGGLVIFLIGLVVAKIVKNLILGILKIVKFESWLKKYGVPEGKDGLLWSNIIAELGRWFVVILFLIPTVEAWGVPQVTLVLNKVLLYLPNIFVAIVITVVGLVFANLGHDLVLASVRGVSPEIANTAAIVTKWIAIVFVILAVLTQLGIAADLIRILFTGIVVMLALAGGLAFGLGGQGLAKDILDDLKKKLK